MNKKLNAFIPVFLLFAFMVLSGEVFPQSEKDFIDPVRDNVAGEVILVYKDTITVPSLTIFDMIVKMKPASEISAISVGFYFPVEYLEILDVELKGGATGYHYNVADSLFRLAWSAVNPISIEEDDTLMVLKMKSLDMSLLEGTIKLGLYELSEFADQSTNIIEGLILEIPEVNYLAPDPQDTIAGISIRVFPNPFDEFLIVDFTLKIESKVKLSLFNPDGLEIQNWDEATYSKGNHQVRIYGSDYAKGIYILKFEIRNSDGEGTKLMKIISTY